MRLLHVIRSMRPETGGLVEAVGNLSPALRALGHEVHTVSLDPADAHQAGATFTVLGRASHGYGRTPDLEPWLRAQHANFDAVIVHGLWQFQGYATRRALRGTGLPYFVFCHGMLDPWFKRTYPLKHLKKWLYWLGAEYRVLRDAAGVCFTAEEERRAARETFWLYRARELITPLGIAAPPPEVAAQRAAWLAAQPGLGERPFLLFLGRIHPKKGLENLLDGYAATRAVAPGAPDLVIVGPCSDEPYLQGLKARVAKRGLERSVRWLGLATGDLKWGALRACEAFVLLSHQENFGMAVVEALACGKPVLISRRINLWREIEADGAGLTGEDDAAGAVAILTQWRDLPAPRRAEMAAAAARTYERRYSSARAAQGLVTALEAAP